MDELLQKLLVRAWNMGQYFRYANMPQEYRDALFMEITRAEANSLLRQNGIDPAYDVHFALSSPDDPFADTQTRQLSGLLPEVDRWPVKGEVWVTLYGMRLVWLGK
jgi:hypothetical protein